MSEFLLEVDLAVELGVQVPLDDEQFDDSGPELDAGPIVAAAGSRSLLRLATAQTHVLVKLDRLEEFVLQEVAPAVPVPNAC